PTRLNRYLAQSGVASRRKADELIASGAVAVNGTVVTALGSLVQPGDAVTVQGRPVSPTQHLYLLLNKPDDTITTRSDERGRSTVLDLVDLPEGEKAALFPVGRLDRHTVGVLLLTTDGELAHRLTHPSFEVEKLYIVRTTAPIKPHQLEQLRQGVSLDDGPARADQAAYVSDDHHEIGLAIHEGRNRIVRRMMEAIGHEVVFLERVRYADLTTAGVRRGKWRRLSPGEVKRLRRLVGLK
ncbi:MAG TPA: pseudouridine synthase, partial [Rhodothermales bacterium]|nr:pseudouridine synthase [Rhodothermales bacterium]